MLRLMAPADLDAMMDLERSLGGNPWSRSHFEGFLASPTTEEKEAPPPENSWFRRGWVEVNAEGLSGFICATVADDIVEIENLAVREACRRRGIGRSLMQTVVEFSRNRRAVVMRLEVRAGNQAARALYEAMGFRATGSRPRYYADTGEDAVLYDLPMP